MSTSRTAAVVSASTLFCLLAVGRTEAAEAAERGDADTLRTYRVGGVLVTAPRPGLIGEPGVTEVPAAVLERLDAGWVDAIGAVVPATRVSVNSRGEAMFNIRGAFERHVPIYLDGVPLTVPWDERVDVTMIPTGAVGAMRVVRGPGSVLDGPNDLGGVVQLLTRDLEAPGSRTLADLRGGSGDLAAGSLVHLRRTGPWSLLGAIERRTRDAFLLPDDLGGLRNQSAHRERSNSALGQTAVFVRGARDLPNEGTAAIFVSRTDASRGVPPEAHLDAGDARYWRIPRWDRWVVAAQSGMYLDWTRDWRVDAGVAFDQLRQVVQSYPDSTYAAPEAVLAADREDGRDRTGTARVRLARAVGEAHLSLGGFTRYAHRSETLESGGEEGVYAQWLSGLSAEWEGPLADRWTARLGGGLQRVSTPETGDKPARGADVAWIGGLRLTREISEAVQTHLTASRRVRFPSLRELYSGALGRFQPNPELGPETLHAVELGGGWVGGAVDLSASVFVSWLGDGIERIPVAPVAPDSVSRLQRVNLTEVRSLGAEAGVHWRPTSRLRIDLQHAILRARAQASDGDFDLLTERRPAHIGYGAATLQLPRGFEAEASVTTTGKSYSLDSRTGELAPVDAWATADLRLAWSRAVPSWSLRRIEAWVRVANLFDETVWSQLGLPEPGRQVFAGIRGDF